MGRLRSAFACAVLSVWLAGCGSAAPDNAAGVVRQAFSLVDQGDIDGVVGITCEAQKATIRQQFDLSGSFGRIVPGVDVNQLIEAIILDTTGLAITQTSGTGDKASVQVNGTMKVSVDAPRLRDMFKKLAEQQGQPVDDATLDGLVSTLQAVSQSIPVNQTVDVVREGGAWKLCSRLTFMQ